MDSVRELEQRIAAEIDVRRLAGRIVWLRSGEREWVGPAEEALAIVRELSPAALWPAFAER